jgi:signal transduction histidine kinase
MDTLNLCNHFSEFRNKISKSNSLKQLYVNSLSYIVREYSFDFAFVYLLNKDSNYELKLTLPEQSGHAFKSSYEKNESWLGKLGFNEDIFYDYNIFKEFKVNSSYSTSFIVYPLSNDDRTFGILGFVKDEGIESLTTNTTLSYISVYSDIISFVATSLKKTRKLNFFINSKVFLDTDQNKLDKFKYLVQKLTNQDSKFNACIIHLFDKGQKNLYGYVSSGIEFKTEDSSRIAIGSAIIGKVYLDGEMRITNTDNPDFGYKNWSLKNNFKSLISIQLKDIFGKPYGVLTLFTKYVYKEQDGDKKYLQSFINQIAFFINNLEKEKFTIHLLEIDKLVSEFITNNKSISEILKFYLKSCIKTINADIGFISLFSKDSNSLKIDHCIIKNEELKEWSPPKELDLSKQDSLVSYVYKNREPFIFPSNTSKDKNRKEYIKNSEHEILNEIIVPLVFQKEFIGIIVLSSLIKHSFSESELAFLQSSSDKVSQLIQNKRFHDASMKLNKFRYSELKIETIYAETVKMATELLDSASCTLWIRENQNGIDKLVLVDHYNLKSDPLLSDLHIMLRNKGGLSWRVIKSVTEKKDQVPNCQIFYNLQEEESGFKNLDFAKKNGFTSMLSVPLIHNDTVFGVLNTHTNSEFSFFEHDKILLQNLAIRCSSSLSHAKIRRKNEKLLEKWTAYNAIANPGIIALTFVHDMRHYIHYLNSDIDTLYFTLKGKVPIVLLDELVDNISEHSSSIRTSVESLINISKRVKTVKKLSSLRKIFDNLYHLFERRFTVKKISFEYKFYDESVSVEDCDLVCYSNEIEQLLFNLTLNSLTALEGKLARPKEIKLIVENSVRKIGKEYVRIKFFDNGRGIKKGLGNEIYKFNYTTKGEEGSGFGLSICKRIVQNHNGEINYESKEGFETTFIIDIPK